MILNLLVVAGLATASVTGYSSGKEGHGGTAVFCEQNGSRPARNEMLDLYEAEAELKIRLMAGGSDVNDMIETAFKRFGVLPDAERGIRAAYELLRTQLSPWVKVDPPMVTTDYISLFPGDRCRRVQIGKREGNELKVKLAELEALSKVSQAAFWVHEAVYEWMSGQFKISTSDIPRLVTGLVFAAEFRPRDLRDLLRDPFNESARWGRFRAAAVRQMLAFDLQMLDPRSPQWGTADEVSISSEASRVTIKLDISFEDRDDADSVCSGVAVYFVGENGETEMIVDPERNPVMQCLGGKRSGEVVIEKPAQLLGKTIAVAFERASLHARPASVTLKFQVFQRIEGMGGEDQRVAEMSSTLRSGSSQLRRKVERYVFRDAQGF